MTRLEQRHKELQSKYTKIKKQLKVHQKSEYAIKQEINDIYEHLKVFGVTTLDELHKMIVINPNDKNVYEFKFDNNDYIIGHENIKGTILKKDELPNDIDYGIYKLDKQNEFEKDLIKEEMLKRV